MGVPSDGRRFSVLGPRLRVTASHPTPRLASCEPAPSGSSSPLPPSKLFLSSSRVDSWWPHPTRLSNSFRRGDLLSSLRFLCGSSSRSFAVSAPQRRGPSNPPSPFLRSFSSRALTRAGNTQTLAFTLTFLLCPKFSRDFGHLDIRITVSGQRSE